uniref:Uncharacterized protein n=1 Tax=Cannabis sativa TaxID=3483 RepID=A0A803QR46_CANSA
MAKLKVDSSSSHDQDFSAEQCNYFEILALQEIYWRQRSKQFWLHVGDKNSKYFHATVSSRRHSNQIVQLKNFDDTGVNWSSRLDQIIIDYFLALYTTDVIDCNSVVNGISSSVTDDHNEALLQTVTPEEIKQAIFQMHPDKAPGPDGMGPGFYQHHWDVIGPDIVHLVTNFFETEDLPLDINETNLVLISKKENFSTMGDLRPIALCNASYKIMAKVLANRMRSVRRIIGPGTTTSILAHPWLSDNDNPFVTSTTLGLNHHTVDSLFHVHDRSWDDSLVRDMFNVRDSTLILSIPLSFSAIDDHWAWIGEKTGYFSVKSAYKLLQTQKSNRPGDNNSSFWRKLWHLKIPPKVKNFMWRAVSDVLPTCLQLSSKGVSVSPMCPVCHHTAESATHILLSCPFALSCWQKADLVPYGNFVGTVGHFLHLVFIGFDDDISCHVGMLCWSLWKAKNTLVWDKKASSPSQVVSSSWTTLDHWIKAQDKMSLLSPSMLDVGNNFEHWTKPTDNTIKITVDGAIFEVENAYGYGIVACDSEGSVIDFVAKYSHGSFSAEVVEAVGVKEALSWLKDKGWNAVEVETDSLLTVQAVFSHQQMTSVFGMITHDCKTLLSSLPNVSLRFVKRSANKVAHFVARRSCFYSDHIIHDVNVLTDYNANL